MIRIAHVVVGHGYVARRVDGYCGREGGRAGGGFADRGRRAPGLPAVGGRGDHDLVDGSAREASVLPDHVQLSGARVDGDRRKARAGAKECAICGLVRRQLLVRNDRQPRPGSATVRRRDKADAGAKEKCVFGANRLEQLEEVVEDARPGIDYDQVADGLCVLPGIEDRPGARPGLTAVSGFGEPGRAASRSHTTYAVPLWTGSAVMDSLSLKKWVASKMAVVPCSDLIRFGLTQVLPPSLEVTVATPVSLLPAPPLAVSVASKPTAYAVPSGPIETQGSEARSYGVLVNGSTMAPVPAHTLNGRAVSWKVLPLSNENPATRP
jgi:hypothetical protein